MKTLTLCLIVTFALLANGCSSLASFINLQATPFQVSTIQFCGNAPALLAAHAGNASLAAAVQTLCETPPGVVPSATQTAALSQALQALASAQATAKGSAP